MQILASLTKSTKKGASNWHFCLAGQSAFAINDELKVIKCDDIEELRKMYKKYTSYGYTPFLKAADPIPVAA